MTTGPDVPVSGEKQGTLLLKNIHYLVTEAHKEPITDGAIYIDGNIIAWIGESSTLPDEYSSADTVLELPRHILIPGLINCHHHMYQHLTRAVAVDNELFGWLKALYLAWNRMTAEDVYYATKLAAAELILGGCTTSADHLYVFPNDVTLDVTVRAAQEVGLRFHPTRGAMSVGVSKGGLPPDECVEEEGAILKDMERCINELHDPKPLSMCRVGLAPCSPFSVSENLMKEAALLARRYPEVRLHTHLAESDNDIAYSQATFGCRPGEYARRVGWDSHDCWFAHCVRLDSSEISQFAASGAGVATCPSSNLRLASGIAPVRAMLDAGVHVGLGVDGAASNDASHMISEARLALLLQRAGGNVGGLTSREALAIATTGAAAVLGRQADLGVLAPGFAADLVAWEVDGTLAFAGARHDLLGALLLCTPSLGRPDLVVVNGKTVVLGGTPTTFDLDELVREVNTRSARLLAKPSS